MRRPGRGDRGSALLITLVVALVGTVALGAAGTLAHGTLRAAEQWRSEGSALYIAESGINEALYRLKFLLPELTLGVYPDDPPSFTGGPDLVGPGAGYEVWVWRAAGTSYNVASLGYRDGVRRLVQIRADTLHHSPFDGSSGDGGGPGTTVPIVPFPEGLENLGVLHLAGNTVYEMGEPGVVTSLCYNALVVEGGARLILNGPLQLWIAADPDFVDPDPHCDTCATASGIYMAGGSGLNVVPVDKNKWAGGDPLNLLIWIPGETSISIDLTGNTMLYGGIYAPFSSLTVSGTADMEGGLVVGSVTVQGSGSLEKVFTYDPDMETIQWPEGTQYLDRRVGDYY